MSHTTPESESSKKNDSTSNVMKRQQQSLMLEIPSDPNYIYPTSVLDALKPKFESHAVHCALLIPARRTAELKNKLRHVLLIKPKTKNVYPSSNNKNQRILVLNQTVAKDICETDPILKELLKQDNHISTCTFTISTSYQDYTVEQVLKQILPVKEIPTAFESIGHIAHVNLRQELLPFQYIVGQVILDKNAPRVTTVVNKVGTIETEFRTFGMQVIAGNDKTNWSVVTVKEEKCTFELDFSNVYWNSRLAGEHKRMVRYLQKEQHKLKKRPLIVADVMAGVGPFAVPVTCAGNNNNMIVHANDLNPTCFTYLNINSKKNKCHNLHTYNMDGRAFVHYLDSKQIPYDHVLMNLPAIAPEFLNAFWSCPWISKTSEQEEHVPRIHVYCFGEKDLQQAEETAIGRCSSALKCQLDKTEHDVVIHVVRDVSPKKNMLCVSFNLPKQLGEVARLELNHHGTKQEKDQQSNDKKDEEEPNSKRIKTG